ncbi:hypothetical protein EON83_12965 [bacterium]|nr:MAG: hypothetical protein EON83_12965 [bacterium]
MKNLLRLIPVGVLALIVSLALRPHPTSVPFIHSPDSASNQTANASAAQKARVQNAMPALPTMFERNQGQFASPAQYIAHAADYSLALSPHEATLWLASSAPSQAQPPSPKAIDTVSCGAKISESASVPAPKMLRMTLVGANERAPMRGQQPLATRVNYFIGKDPKKWQRDIKTVGQVKYNGVYSGIDLVYYGKQGQLEYDFVVAPGANPGRIKMHFDGMERLELNSRGELLLHVGKRTVTQHAPVIYQMLAGKRRHIEGRYVLLPQNHVGFSIGYYNTRSELVIDPVIKYSTFLSGGENNEYTQIRDVAVDKNGDLYITGHRNNVAGLTLVGKSPTVLGTTPDLAYHGFFVAKFKSDLSGLQYLTWISGSTNSTDSTAIAADGSGQLHVVGVTYDPTVPTPGGFQTTINTPAESSGACSSDTHTQVGYYATLSAAGNNITYGTFIGGLAPDQKCSQDDRFYQMRGRTTCYDVAVRSDGVVAITGGTDTSNCQRLMPASQNLITPAMRMALTLLQAMASF